LLSNIIKGQFNMVGSDRQAHSFWFVNDKARTFPGAFDEEQLEIHTTTLEDSYFVSQVIANNKEFIVQGNLHNERRITVIASSLGSSEEIHNLKMLISRVVKYAEEQGLHLRELELESEEDDKEEEDE
jgi:hypothetical protein